MKTWLRVCLGAAAIVWGGSSFASTVAYTEGNRDLVVGTVPVVDALGNPPGMDIDGTATIGFGADEFSHIDLHGDIIYGKDRYSFASSGAFAITFLFDGYSVAGGFVPDSGLVAQYKEGNSTEFSLTSELPGISESRTIETDLTGGSSLIFWGGKGDYVFEINGNGPTAYYDIRIAAVDEATLSQLRLAAIPLPLSGPLLLASLGALGLVRHRRRRLTNVP